MAPKVLFPVGELLLRGQEAITYPATLGQMLLPEGGPPVQPGLHLLEQEVIMYLAVTQEGDPAALMVCEKEDECLLLEQEVMIYLK
jgi:hypothetical protein